MNMISEQAIKKTIRGKVRRDVMKVLFYGLIGFIIWLVLYLSFNS